jgi:hypothetical protein
MMSVTRHVDVIARDIFFDIGFDLFRGDHGAILQWRSL